MIEDTRNIFGILSNLLCLFIEASTNLEHMSQSFRVFKLIAQMTVYHRGSRDRKSFAIKNHVANGFHNGRTCFIYPLKRLRYRVKMRVPAI